MRPETKGKIARSYANVLVAARPGIPTRPVAIRRQVVGEHRLDVGWEKSWIVFELPLYRLTEEDRDFVVGLLPDKHRLRRCDGPNGDVRVCVDLRPHEHACRSPNPRAADYDLNGLGRADEPSRPHRKRGQRECSALTDRENVSELGKQPSAARVERHPGRRRRAQ